MNLHTIRLPGRTAWVWLAAMGGNGQIAGRGAFQHLYFLERLTAPPPMPTVETPRWQRTARMYWEPWNNLNTLNPRATLCGDIHSTARRLRVTNGYAWNAHCPDCERTAATHGIPAQRYRDMLAADPWYAMHPNLRLTTPDPVTGR